MDIEDVKFLAIIIISLVCSVAAVNFLSSLSCEKQWADSGMDSRYSFFGGCQIKVDGLWIPSRVYRDIGDES